MTLTFNRDTYGSLLATYQPRIIETEEENKYFLELAENLLNRSDLTLEEAKFLALIIKLIEDFENKSYPLDRSTPHSRLNHLIEARELDKQDIAFIFESPEDLENVLAGKAQIDLEKAEKLANFFNVNPNLFI